ncbi:MAG: hypothetical protein H8E14_02015 [Candidatus Marinimicrobia bacterium]|nr:hypothetical protein [Candidatus Neomarinimicrobiota bacterium]
MDTLALIGGILFLVGLLIFSLKLMAYNRRKYDLENNLPESVRNYMTPSTVIRILALIIFIVALVIIVIAS